MFGLAGIVPSVFFGFFRIPFPLWKHFTSRRFSFAKVVPTDPFQIPPGHFHVIDPIRIYARFEPSHYRYRVICFPDPARFFTCTSVSPLVPIMYHKNFPFARRKLVQISQVSLVRSADFILFAQFMVDIRSYTVVY